MSMINIIVAAAENNVIGKNNDLIWHLPDDLKFFRATTSGHPIIMGRKTYESVGRPLPKRTNIIITSDKDYTADGCVIVHSLKEALEVSDDTEQFVVGGEQIYRLALPLADRVYLTRVHATPNGDRFFPELGTEWKQTAEEFHPADETHEHAFTFFTFVKQRN